MSGPFSDWPTPISIGGGFLVVGSGLWLLKLSQNKIDGELICSTQIATEVLRCLLFMLAQLGCIHQTPVKTAPITQPWLSSFEQAHPLIGQWWSTTEQRILTETEAQGMIREAHFILLGEIHDNPDHHSHQAKALYWATQGRTQSTVAFEMLNDPQKIAQADQSNSSRLAIGLDWVNSGWPAFEYYAPIFDVALSHQSTLVAANPSKSDIMGTMTNGLTHSAFTSVDVTRPFPDALQAELNQEIIDSLTVATPILR